MGVTGLWRLIEPAGKPVPVETLENKVLAVDISIWLHQMVKGYQDAKGAPIANAHLMGLFQRLCKLLYFRIKPVFVFDGGFPELKKETIAKRQYNKAKYNSESERIKRELAILLSKKTAISSLLGKDISPKKGNAVQVQDDDLFKLPDLPEIKEESESESDDEQNSSGSIIDLHSVDLHSDQFKGLPAKEKYDLLLELKETRKMNSWGKIHELPKKSDSFSDFQMQRLLKRRKVQECLEETEKEMGGGGMSLNELESLLNEEGIDTNIEIMPTKRIASNNTTRYLLINNVKKALEDAKKIKELENNPGSSTDRLELVKSETKSEVKDELEEDLEKAIKMSLECVDEQNTSISKTDDSWTSFTTDTDYTDEIDSEEEDGFEQPDMTSAKAYIMQYSDFTNKAIDKIISSKTDTKNKIKTYNVDEIIKDINLEKSVIVDKICLSSDEDSQDSCNETKAGLMDFHESSIEPAPLNATQDSVIYIENESENVISLDTSTKEQSVDVGFTDITVINNELDINSLNTIDSSTKDMKIKEELESSDDEFEEVAEIETETKKTIVQVTLNVDQMCDDKDDIFADIFNTKITEPIGDVKINSESVTHTIISPQVKVISNDKKIKNMGTHEDKDILNYSKINDKVITTNVKTSQSSQLLQNCTSRCANTVSVSDAKVIDDVNKKNREFIITSTSDSEVADDVNKDSILFKKVTSTSDTKVADVNEDSELFREVASTRDTKKADDGNKSNEIFREERTEKLNEMAKDVATEENELLHEKGRLDRVGRNITEQMTKEAQELLQIFGIPYIVAPMEAEAQCAFLENIKLTDGTITDDSDIWLFGGKTVYKNFFNQKKHVLQFLSDRIERSFNLSREQLVLLSLLVGSDYTTGVDGVGPVTAMEILASFPYNKKQVLNETSKQGRYQQIIAGLQEFKKWVRAGKRTDNTNLKKKLRNVALNDDFPSVRVVQAYMEPNVEESDEKFTWGELDITILRDYTKAKFGWSQNKLDEIITPVLKRITERKSQKSMQDYFKRKVEFQSLEGHMSKRVKAAVQKLGPEILIDNQLPVESKEVVPSKRNKANPKTNKTTKVNLKSTILPGTSKSSAVVVSNICEINTNDTVVSSIISSKAGEDIIIPKTGRFQEIIPQREKEKRSLLQNKLKAIELFRKTKIDCKQKPTKRKAILPKEKAELSESSESD